VVGGGEGGGDVASTEKVLPKVGGEDRVTVRDELRGKSMEFHNMVEEEISNLGSSERFGSGDKVSKFGEAVNNNKYRVQIVDWR
jgi:hypothetical protein